MGQVVLSFGPFRHIVVGENGYAFANSGLGVQEIDVSVPENPVAKGFYPTPFPVEGLDVWGSYLYLAGSNQVFQAKLEVVRVGAHGEMQGVKSLGINNISGFYSQSIGSALEIGNAKVYFGSDPVVIDISAPENPRLITTEGWIGPVSDLKYSDGYLFAGLVCCGVNAVDIRYSTPTVRYSVAGIVDRGGITLRDRVAVQGEYVYAAIDELGVLIIKRNF